MTSDEEGVFLESQIPAALTQSVWYTTNQEQYRCPNCKSGRSIAEDELPNDRAIRCYMCHYEFHTDGDSTHSGRARGCMRCGDYDLYAKICYLVIALFVTCAFLAFTIFVLGK